MHYKILKKYSPEEATEIIKKARVSGKRLGEKPWDTDIINEPMALIDLPLNELTPDELETITSTSDPKLVDQYSKAKIDTPIYAKKSRKGNWFISDGGHRTSAAILRGDKTIPAIVPLKDITTSHLESVNGYL